LTGECTLIKPEIDEDGDKRWHDSDGNLHRDDGPATEHISGTKVWYQHGKRHRDDGPAVEWVSGTKHWYQHGKKHREDGPAIIYTNGTKSWYLNDNCLSFDEWLNEADILDEDKVMMKLKYG
jgi:hypothetical protein